MENRKTTEMRMGTMNQRIMLIITARTILTSMLKVESCSGDRSQQTLSAPPTQSFECISPGLTQTLNVHRHINVVLSIEHRVKYRKIQVAAKLSFWFAYMCLIFKSTPLDSHHTPYLCGFASEFKSASYLPAGGAVE